MVARDEADYDRIVQGFREGLYGSDPVFQEVLDGIVEAYNREPSGTVQQTLRFED